MSECNWIVTTSFKKPIDLHDDDRVMIALDIGAGVTHEGGPYRASAVTWGKVTRYRRVVENGDVERMRAQLDEARGSRQQVVDLLNDMNKENAALRTQLAARPSTEDLASARHQVTGLQTLNDELVAQGATMRQRFHELAMAQMEHIAATHAGIKRGIEVGDLPPDYYGRFGTVWAPAK